MTRTRKHPSRSRGQRRKWIAETIAEPYLADCAKQANEAKQADLESFQYLTNDENSLYGSPEALQQAQLPERPKSKSSVKQKPINVAYDLDKTSDKYGKAYPFKALKIDYSQQKRTVSLNALLAGNGIALRISRPKGNALRLAKYGFGWNSEYKVWVVNRNNLDFELFFAENPLLEGLVK